MRLFISDTSELGYHGNMRQEYNYNLVQHLPAHSRQHCPGIFTGCVHRIGSQVSSTHVTKPS